MRTMRTVRFLLAALVVLAGARVASAQTKTDTQIGGWNVEGYIEPGLRFFGENPNGDRTPGKADAKFEEYRDINTGLYLEGLRLRIFRPDESLSLQISGKDWGLHTQEYHLLGEHIGQWQAGFDWDQMRHIYSTNAQTLTREFGDNVFIIRGGPGSSARPPLSAWNSAPPWGCSESSVRFGSQDCDGQISQQWYTGRLFFKISPTPNLDLSAEFTRLHKDGQRPFGMAFASPGGIFLELVQPIDQTTYEFRTRGTWATEMFQLQWGYTASVFVNDFAWVRADNPCNPAPVPAGVCPAVGTTGQFGTTSLPPDNQAHTFNLAGGINLPLRTRVNASFTYGFRFQNQDFQQQTYSNSLVLTNPSLRLPENSLHGNVQTALFNLDVTSRPFQAPVTFTLKYRLNDLMDFSDKPTFSAFILNDQNAISVGPTSAPLRAGRYDYLRQNANLDARYQINKSTALTLGIGWEGWNRNNSWEVTQTDEAIAKAALDVTPYDWLLVRATYLPSFRRGNAYNTGAFGAANRNEAPGSNPQDYEMRKFNEADRNRQRFDLMTQITPIDTLSFSPTAGYKYDDYIASGLKHNGNTFNRELLGLQTVVSWSAGMDINWAPSDRISFSAGYVHESNFQKQRETVRNPLDPSLDWLSNSTDTVDTFHGNIKATILPEKLDFLFNGSYSYALGRVQQYSPNATGSTVYSTNQPADVTIRWPAFEDTYARLEAALQYHFTKSLTGKLFYVYESFTKHDWQTDTITPSLAGVPAVFLGADQKNYWAQIVGVTLRYKFE
jgi:MtrB/PioB family decaheme-associated outer membrane protein